MSSIAIFNLEPICTNPQPARVEYSTEHSLVQGQDWAGKSMTKQPVFVARGGTIG